MSEDEDFERRQEIADELCALHLRIQELREEYAEILTRNKSEQRQHSLHKATSTPWIS